jgi:uncharacterized protein with NRDE domain
MCLIAFHWKPEASEPLLIAGNRDEFYDRPTAPLAWWEGGRILAGRDLRAGGTWLGVASDGRCAVLTNHRNPLNARPNRASRGQLPVRFLEGPHTAASFLAQLRLEAAAYNPFNLLLFDGIALLGYESRRDRIVAFTPGVHAVSNGDFDEPWPKVARIMADFAAIEADDAALLARLAESRPFPDGQLPRTGVSLAWERLLSPAFVHSATYGTRASTLLRLGHDRVSMLEQRFNPQGSEGRATFAFRTAPGGTA